MTTKESRNFPGFQTSMDFSSKGDSGSKLLSHVHFSEETTLATWQCAHDRVHLLTTPETPVHQNCNTIRLWDLYTPVCSAVGDA